MIHLPGGISECRCDILIFKEGVVRKDLLPGGACRNQIEHVAHPEAMAPDAGTSATFAGLNRDSLKQVHGIIMRCLPLGSTGFSGGMCRI